MPIATPQIASTFEFDIEEIVEMKDVGYLEALTIYAQERNVEIEVVSALVKANKVIEGRLREECAALNLVAKIPTLEL